VIKCVVWDLDNTLLDGVYLESPDQPPGASRELTGALRELAGRGILQAIASKNPPEACRHAQLATGHAFAASQCGWGPKSAAIRSIAADLGLTEDELAFVDDDAMERGEVAFSLPEVLVLAPRDVAEAAGWPQFSPPAVTEEARRRGELYLQRRARQEEAKAFGGSREEFLRHNKTRVTIAPAAAADLPRLHELSVRTHQFNSAGTSVAEQEFAAMLGSDAQRVITVRLADRFGDDGMVGGCVLATGDGAGWQVPLLMMSCRALGRGVIDALLTWVCRSALAAGAAAVTLPCVISPRSVPLRIALTGAGFRTAAQPGAGMAEYVRDLAQPLPDLPPWVSEVSG
jgi:methoxymalonate biosynthesis protein